MQTKKVLKMTISAFVLLSSSFTLNSCKGYCKKENKSASRNTASMPNTSDNNGAIPPSTSIKTSGDGTPGTTDDIAKTTVADSKNGSGGGDVGDTSIVNQFNACPHLALAHLRAMSLF
jgi:hypothetical protein